MIHDCYSSEIKNHLSYDNIGNERNIDTVRVGNLRVASVGDLAHQATITIDTIDK